MKNFVLIGGLSGTGKDTVAEIFCDYGYFLINYRTEILVPVVNDPSILYLMLPCIIQKLAEQLRMDKCSIDNLVNDLNVLKIKFSDRELYVNVAITLNRYFNYHSEGYYPHFNVLLLDLYENRDKMVVPNFRQAEEIIVLRNLFKEVKVKTLLLTTEDSIRHKRLKKRDGLALTEIKERDRFEKMSTYDKLVQEIRFDYRISNNGSKMKLRKSIESIIDGII